MYQLLPFISAYTTALPNLPVEIWCVILKRLDPTSLFTVVRTSSFFYFVAQGESTLREMVRNATEQEQQHMFALLTQPGMSTTITRQDYARLFDKNVKKDVSVRRLKTESLIGQGELPKKSRGSGGPIRKTIKSARFNPYRL